MSVILTPSLIVLVTCIVLGSCFSKFTNITSEDIEDTDVEIFSTGEKLSRLRTGKKYHLNTIVQLNWFQALAHCHSLNMKLVSFESKEEYDELVETLKAARLPSTTKWWTSGADLGEKGNYVWMSTGRPFTYSKFRDDQPNHEERNGQTEHCVEIEPTLGYVWNDNLCETRLYHICEY